MSDKHLRLCVYSLSHFAVDFCCALVILPLARRSEAPALVYILYNLCAFALQMPLGLLADRMNHNALFALVGCVLVAAGSPRPFPPLFAAAIAGIGNALFHVGGGVDTLNDADGKASALGVFVSPGALGLYLGGMLTKTDFRYSRLLVLALMLICALIILFAAGKTKVLVESHNAEVSFQGLRSPAFLLSAAALFLVVVLRSLAGMTMTFPWKAKVVWGLFSTLAVVLGKACGGFAMDKLGVKATVVSSLLLSSTLFLLSENPVCGVLAIFLFNMTMPVTLSLLARKMPDCKGFSFGILTFALFLGFVPVGLSLVSSLSGAYLAGASLLSLLLLLPAVHPHDR